MLLSAFPSKVGLFGVQVDGHNKTVQTQHLSEDQNQDHAHKESVE